LIPIDGWPEPFKPLNEPIRTLIGRYEAGLARDRNHSSSTLLWVCDAIEGFFYDHPRVKRPEQILITDVEDWRLAKLETYGANMVRKDLGALKAFYRWLAHELPEYSGLDNPVWYPLPETAKPARGSAGVTELHPDLRPAED
jgi:hypothetical protein